MAEAFLQLTLICALILYLHHQDLFEMKSNKILLSTLFVLFSSLPLQAQLRISGFIKDAESKEPMIGVNIYSLSASKGTTTDYHGRFSLILEKADSIAIRFMGYQDIRLLVSKDSTLQINMHPSYDVLDEVRVRPIKHQNSSNISHLSSKEMMLMPSLSAKPDVLKSLQNLPGIMPLNEGSGLLMVRGGDPGQNLYLIDDIPLIYVNHLGGLMSVFNPDMINHVNVYKGGFPARFGSKISSIVDIAQKEGNANGFSGNLSIGLTDASITLEGPTKVKNSSFIINGRKTLTDPLMLTVSQFAGGGLARVWYGFHDVNAKWSWRPNDKNSFHLNFYQGDDYLGFAVKERDAAGSISGSNRTIWGNWMASARWNHQFSNQLFLTQSVSYTRYRLRNQLDYTFRQLQEENHYFRMTGSSVQDYSYRSALKYDVKSFWAINAGIQSSVLIHQPNIGIEQNRVILDESITSTENALFAENDFRFLRNSSLQVGMRAVNFRNATFSDRFFEPRVNLNLGLNENHRLQASYMQVNQFAHLLFTGNAIWNNEVWVPADERISPAHSHQYSIGWAADWQKGMWTTELSAYYKTMSGLAAYREGIQNLVGDANWRGKVSTDGLGTAYGLEWMLRKNTGAWQGFLSYTYARTFRQFEDINQGRTFAFEFDRPHVASLNINRKLSPKWDASVLFVYQSGLPFTPLVGTEAGPGLFPSSPFERFPTEMLIFGERNSQRMIDYHRMDVAFHYKKKTKKGRDAVWTFSVYNLYARQNPYYYFYGINPSIEYPWGRSGESFNLDEVKLYQVGFFPIIPSVSYRLYLDGSKFNKESLKNSLNNTKSRFLKWLFIE